MAATVSYSSGTVVQYVKTLYFSKIETSYDIDSCIILLRYSLPHPVRYRGMVDNRWALLAVFAMSRTRHSLLFTPTCRSHTEILVVKRARGNATVPSMSSACVRYLVKR